MHGLPRAQLYNGATRIPRIYHGPHSLLGLAVAVAASLAGCEWSTRTSTRLGGGGTVRTRRADLAASQVTTIGVNAYLWRAALDTLSFMPLPQADPNGGVIVTDWYSNPQSPSERVKVTVTILDQDLRADALRVAASRQVQPGRHLGRRAGRRPRPCRSSRTSSSPRPATCAATPSAELIQGLSP